MVEAGKTVQTNVKDRLANVQTTIKDQVGLFRKVLEDVRGRVGAEGKEPSLPKEVGLPGRTGGLLDMGPALVLGSIDNFQKGVRAQALITRRWTKRS